MEKGKLQKEGLSNWNTKNYGEVTEREAWERNCKTVCNWNALFFFNTLFSQKAAEGTRFPSFSEGFPSTAGVESHDLQINHEMIFPPEPEKQIVHLPTTSTWVYCDSLLVSRLTQLKHWTKGKWRDKQLVPELYLKWKHRWVKHLQKGSNCQKSEYCISEFKQHDRLLIEYAHRGSKAALHAFLVGHKHKDGDIRVTKTRPAGFLRQVCSFTYLRLRKQNSEWRLHVEPLNSMQVLATKPLIGKYIVVTTYQ